MSEKVVYSISKAQWEAIEPDLRDKVQEALGLLEFTVEEALTVSDQELFLDEGRPKQNAFWQRILVEDDDSLVPSQPDRDAISALEAQALAALSPEGLDLANPPEVALVNAGAITSQVATAQESIARAFDTHPCEETCCDGGCEPDYIPAPGDQPPPVQNDGPAIQSLVIQDVAARLQVGIERYGTPLQANNGRDALWDAYQEALDLVVYLRQMIAERDGQ